MYRSCLRIKLRVPSKVLLSSSASIKQCHWPRTSPSLAPSMPWAPRKSLGITDTSGQFLLERLLEALLCCTSHTYARHIVSVGPLVNLTGVAVHTRRRATFLFLVDNSHALSLTGRSKQSTFFPHIFPFTCLQITVPDKQRVD